MTNLKEISHYLGIEIDVEIGKKHSFRQITYLKKILECFQITDYKSASLFISLDVAHSLFSFHNQAN